MKSWRVSVWPPAGPLINRTRHPRWQLEAKFERCLAAKKLQDTIIFYPGISWIFSPGIQAAFKKKKICAFAVPKHGEKQQNQGFLLPQGSFLSALSRVSGYFVPRESKLLPHRITETGLACDQSTACAHFQVYC